MGSRDLEEDVYEFLQRIQLEQFFDKIHHQLHLSRLSHFDHVTQDDLTEINMSKPEQRRLFDSLKKLKKRSVFSRLSFKVCELWKVKVWVYSRLVVKNYSRFGASYMLWIFRTKFLAIIEVINNNQTWLAMTSEMLYNCWVLWSRLVLRNGYLGIQLVTLFDW